MSDRTPKMLLRFTVAVICFGISLGQPLEPIGHPPPPPPNGPPGPPGPHPHGPPGPPPSPHHGSGSHSHSHSHSKSNSHSHSHSHEHHHHKTTRRGTTATPVRSSTAQPGTQPTSTCADIYPGKPCMQQAGNANYCPDPLSCYYFYQCAPQGWTRMPCGPGTAWNPAISVCDWPYNVPSCSNNSASSPPPITPSNPQSACATCEKSLITIDTDVGTVLPSSDVISTGLDGCRVRTIECRSITPNAQVVISYWADELGTKVGFGSVTDVITCNDSGSWEKMANGETRNITQVGCFTF